MKKAFLLFFLVNVILTVHTFAQTGCPNCTPDQGYTVSPAAPAMNPMTLPDATAGVYYEQVIQVYLPQTFHISTPISIDVTLQSIDITGLIGMPTGLLWTKDGGGRTWTVTSNTATQHGCVTICGTPITPGNYNVTINVTATVDAGTYGVQASPQSFVLPIVVLPGSGGNASYTITPASGCDTADVTFHANLINTPEYPANTYSWDFGNGHTATGQDPPVQRYIYTPLNNGVFVVSQTTTFYGYQIVSVSGHSTGSQVLLCWTGWFASSFGTGVNETCTRPDMFFTIEGATSPTVANSMDASWTWVHDLSSYQFRIQFYDEDNVWFGLVQNDDGGYADIVCNPSQYVYSYNTGKVSGNINVVPRQTDMITVVDTVYAYPSPVVPSITSLPNDSVCSGVMMSLVSSDTVNSINWYLDGTEIAGQTAPTYETTQSGLYKLKVTSPEGCSNESTLSIVTFPLPVPNLPRVWRVPQTNTFKTNGAPNLQWYRLVNGIGEELPGRTRDTLVIGDSLLGGNYFVTSTNSYGCMVQSDTFNLQYIPNIGINEIQVAENFRLYPNPSNDLINIEFNNTGKVNELTIYNSLGQIVYKESISHNQLYFKKEFAIGQYGKGIYSVSLISKDGKKLTQRFIIR